MDCGRFDKLIDSYLDSQLNGSLLAEFHAHRLACRRCSRVISMLQAAGDVIAHDRSGEPKISMDFADRIVAALPAVTRKTNRSLWLVRMTAGAAGLAAAASITLAVLLSGRPGTRVAGGGAVVDDSDVKVPQNVELKVHRTVVPKGDLITGEVVRHAVDQVVSWTEYRLKGKDQAE